MSKGVEWFRQRRQSGRIGVVGVSRLLVLQVIQVALFVLLAQGLWVAILVGVVSTTTIVVVFGRWRGRWCTDLVVLWWRFRRRRGVTRNQVEDARLAALGELVPDLVVEDVPGPDETRMGMGGDGAGWFAVLEVEPAADQTSAEVDPPVPLAALARIAAEAGLPGVVMQLVSYSGQSPPESAAPAGVVERQRQLWVAVRMDADEVVSASVGAVEDPEQQIDVPAVLAELTRRVRRALKRRGLGTRVLDVDGLIDALMLSCDLSGPHQPDQVREDWGAWHSPRLAHRCFWLRTWPAPDRGTSLLAKLRELPEARVHVALVLQSRDEAEADLRCLVRVATHPQRAEPVAEVAIRLAEREGGHLFPLDGEHAPAVYASAPSGGGAR